MKHLCRVLVVVLALAGVLWWKTQTSEMARRIDVGSPVVHKTASAAPAEVLPAVEADPAEAVRVEAVENAALMYGKDLVSRFPGVRERIPLEGDGLLTREGAEKIKARFASNFNEGVEIEGRGAILRQSLVGSTGATITGGDPVAVYREVLPGVDSLIVRRDGWVEEFLRILPGAAAPMTYEFRIESEGVEFAEVEGLHVRDLEGKYLLSMDNIVYWRAGEDQLEFAETSLTIVDGRAARVTIRIPAADQGQEILLDPGWALTGSMKTARGGPGVVRLADGRVLASGGADVRQWHKTSEIYSPTTGAWSTAYSMSTARSRHTLTLLPNGKVLGVGGENSAAAALSSCEVFDPSTKRWTTTASTASPRHLHGAVLLQNGKVLVAGGRSQRADCELYDYTTGTWSVTGSLLYGTHEHSTTLLADGRVLVAAGEGGWSRCQIYDPASQTWSATGSLWYQVEAHSAVLLSDGRVLLSGGWWITTQNTNGNNLILRNCELYNPVTGTWSTTGYLVEARMRHTATRLADGRVLITGGFCFDPLPNQTRLSTEIWNPATSTASLAGNMVIGRQFHTAVLLNSGKVLVAGHNDDKRVDLYTP